MGFFCETHLFHHLGCSVYLEKNEPFCTLKTMSCRKYSFQDLTQFSQEKHILDAPASSTDDVLLRESLFHQLSQIGLLKQNEPFSTLKTMICQEEFF
jgi:hypothetical protein